ncbi:MAG TPA: sigma-70 family RNA polymerase sigma factor [Anaerolineaceae bacterium]|nr:sigma-70 family RNA polymerase sigma factor [Anaerolineaceae bacterium]NMC16929.1 sigma-70 family RNA polymerase sigma factor [Chloroflexota bacterium]HNS06744.1 sigma-70 family RNA polymerase sigma factor [Anaerolineaceae bacterium]HNW13519.1 sigma-70 family RNA polymerase sigma factor [Anaerolineaceae bacterium]HOE02851.1 sigma-70 family RNA polymerase sigma factor [Anaerolineaceae bacterium]
MKQIDPIWIERARHGDEEAFTMLVEAYQTPVFNLCYRMLGESTAAEDAAQETFWRVWQKIKSYDPQRSFSTWVLSIAAHYCIDQQRKQKITIFELDEYPDFDLGDPHMPNPEITVITNEEEETLHRMINQLNPPDRAAVILKYWYGCSEEEISQMLSLTVSAVKSRLHRARRQLAEVVTKNQSTTLQRGSSDEALSL